MPPVKTPEAAPEAPAPPKAGDFNQAVNDLLSFAQALRDEKDGLYARIEANRTMLRGYVTQGLCNAEQASAVAAFYPKPKRGESEDTTNGTASA